MNGLKWLSYLASALILVIIVGFVYGPGVPPFSRGSDQDWRDPVALYFLAKGIFCAVALILLYNVYEAVARRA